jgi:hypothetical protein
VASRRFLIAETWVQSQASSHIIRCERNCIGTALSPSSSVFDRSSSSHCGPILISHRPTRRAIPLTKQYIGREMNQVVSRRHLIAEARIRGRVSPRGICDGQSGTGTGSSLKSPVFSRQHHSTVAIHTHIIGGMNNRPVGGRSSESPSHSIDMTKRPLSQGLHL